MIRVRRSWDPVEGEVAPKSKADKRAIPIAAALRGYLIAHRLRSGRPEGLVLGRDAERPFTTTTAYGRSAVAWKHLNALRRSSAAAGIPDECWDP